MIDLILIQDHRSGIGLFQYKGKTVYLDPSHEDLFQGFLSAFQSIIHELKLGKLKQISTEEHHFVIHYDGENSESPINVIMMFDCEDCVETLRNKAKEIGCEFRNMFGDSLKHTDTAIFEGFKIRLERILETDVNTCVEMNN